MITETEIPTNPDQLTQEPPEQQGLITVADIPSSGADRERSIEIPESQVLYEYDDGINHLNITRTNEHVTVVRHFKADIDDNDRPEGVSPEQEAANRKLAAEMQYSRSRVELYRSTSFAPIVEALGMRSSGRRLEDGRVETTLVAPTAQTINRLIDSQPELFSFRAVEHSEGHISKERYAEFLAQGLMPIDVDEPDMTMHDPVDHVGFIFIAPEMAKTIQAHASRLVEKMQHADTLTEAEAATLDYDLKVLASQVDPYTAGDNAGVLESTSYLATGYARRPGKEEALLDALGVAPADKERVLADVEQHAQQLAQFAKSLAESRPAA